MIKRRKRHFTPKPDERPRLVHPVIVRSTRVLFPEAEGMREKIGVQFEDATGRVYQFDLEVKEAARLIEETLAAYNVINPPLKTSRGGWGL